MKIVIERQIERGETFPLYSLRVEEQGYLLNESTMTGREIIRRIKPYFKKGEIMGLIK